MDDTRRGKLTKEAFNPATGQLDMRVLVREQRLEGVGRLGNMAAICTAAYTLIETLKSPDAVFEGLRFDEDEPRNCNDTGWLCYAKHPARRYNDTGGTFATPVDRIFLAFVTTDYVVYNWVWEEADENALGCGECMPNDYENRFAKQVYPTKRTFSRRKT
ncbi:MAG: hypothetical protein LBI05_09460 [Planctomycetaceae bacterium]|jgi:hypothetical protein|nr:hypothetical protein [Planctomycetaceae bacterium]